MLPKKKGGPHWQQLERDPQPPVKLARIGGHYPASFIGPRALAATATPCGARGLLTMCADATARKRPMGNFELRLLRGTVTLPAGPRPASANNRGRPTPRGVRCPNGTRRHRPAASGSLDGSNHRQRPEAAAPAPRMSYKLFSTLSWTVARRIDPLQLAGLRNARGGRQQLSGGLIHHPLNQRLAPTRRATLSLSLCQHTAARPGEEGKGRQGGRGRERARDDRAGGRSRVAARDGLRWDVVDQADGL